MNRRNLIFGFGTTLLAATGFRGSRITAAKESSVSSQSDAIALVIKKGQKDIGDAEAEYFKQNGVGTWQGDPKQYHWFDTLGRSWTAWRPVAPGIVDSTHWFKVTYAINGAAVASWSIDLRKNTLKLVKVDEIF
jgi:hypothetical protein